MPTSFNQQQASRPSASSNLHSHTTRTRTRGRHHPTSSNGCKEHGRELSSPRLVGFRLTQRAANAAHTQGVIDSHSLVRRIYHHLA